MASQPSSPTGLKTVKSAVWSSLKKPFQGWSMALLAAKDDLDDEYNFTDGRRRGYCHDLPNDQREKREEEKEKTN
jgi:hypothetical protein